MRNILDASSIRETRTKTGNLFAQTCLALYIQRCIYLKNKCKKQKLSMQLVGMPRKGKCSENVRATHAILHHYSTTLTKNNPFLNN